MQVSIETLDGLARKMTVQIPSERVSEAVEKKLKELSKTVRIDGFRPGKVPLKGGAAEVWRPCSSGSHR